jgi:acetyltransferase
VGRLTSDPDRRTANFALLVVDDWQGRGLGGLLTDYCLELADRWGLHEVVAETEPDNARMLAILRRRGFELDARPADHVVFARRKRPSQPTAGAD